MAEEASSGPIRPVDESRAERLHTFAHDIKNRLGSLYSSIGLLSASPEPEQRDELLLFAERNFFNALRDVESLLDDLGVERGITLKAREPVDLAVCAGSAVKNEGFRLEKKRQHVNITSDAATEVMGDAHWLVQLFQALVSNASKFSPAGATIDVRLAREGTEAIVRVTDHGVGLSTGDLSLIFKRYTMPSSRSTDGETQSRGTLARAKQWAEAHGGSLTASSQGTGKGSVFEVRLPLGTRNTREA